MSSDLATRIADRSMTVGVIGLGYVGMPLAMAFAEAGFKVVGVDVVNERVAGLMGGRSHLLDVSSERIRAQTTAGRFEATVEYSALSSVDVIFVCVPTPFDRAKAPDLSYIRAAAEGLRDVIGRGQLVILESTTYPGTTEEVLVPVLEGSGLRAGIDFHVAFSPERIDPGNRRYTIANTPKVVGGVDAESTRRAALVLRQVVSQGDVHEVSNPRVAEMTKLLENTFRAVNIALVNELAILCDRMSIDVWEVIGAARTKPYGFMPFYPGPGVGGHCIPVDPYYLAWKAREYDFSTKFIDIAAETNQMMPFFTVEKLRRALADRGVHLLGAKILVLGVAFKRDIDDARNSSAIRVIEIMLSQGASVRYHDPYVPMIRYSRALYGGHEHGDGQLTSVALTDDELRNADCVAILVGHSAVEYGRILQDSSFVFDAVNATDGLEAGDGSVVKL